LDDFLLCLMSCYFPLCMSGSNQSSIGVHGAGFCAGCCCYPCFCGCFRSNVQNALGVPDTGCMLNWYDSVTFAIVCLVFTFFSSYIIFICFLSFIHFCLSCCALTQEARAIKAWQMAGSPRPAPPAVAM
jgi:hypothetical protein